MKEVDDDKGNVTFEYSIDKNSEIAKNLKGHLMLVTGDYDNNVHPANTVRLADALIRANKRFDFMLFPGQRHAYAAIPITSTGAAPIISASICSATPIRPSTCGN